MRSLAIAPHARPERFRMLKLFNTGGRDLTSQLKGTLILWDLNVNERVLTAVTQFGFGHSFSPGFNR